MVDESGVAPKNANPNPARPLALPVEPRIHFIAEKLQANNGNVISWFDYFSKNSPLIHG
jgi:hypothetical protein